MKITAKSNKKKEVFKPITVSLEVVIENQEDFNSFKEVEKYYKNDDLLIQDYGGDKGYEEFGIIFQKIAEQL